MWNVKQSGSGLVTSILLEVPPKRDDNNCMLDREIRMWVKEEMGELYWKFRDDIDDEGGKKLEEEIGKFEMVLVDVMKKHLT